jgi:smad nuclear-interacting protein 1
VKRQPDDGRDDGDRRDASRDRRRADSRGRDDRRRRRSWSRSRSPEDRVKRERNSPRRDVRRSRSRSPPRRRSRWDRDDARRDFAGDERERRGDRRDENRRRADGADDESEITETIPCAGYEGRIVGKGGSVVTQIQRETGARVRVDRAKGECVVSGSAEQVVLAGVAVRDAMRAGGAPPPFFGGAASNGIKSEMRSETIPCAGFEGRIIGRGGETIKRLRSEHGARVDVDAANGACVVSGSADAVTAASAAIRALIEQGDAGHKDARKREDDGDDGGGTYGPRGDDALAPSTADLVPAVPPEAPNFGLSGALAKETNTVNGVVLVYTEPVDKAPPPTTKYRLYVFKDGKLLNDAEPLRVHRQSFYLFGRDRLVADVPTDHPSCSKQHAVLQYRLRERFDEEKGLDVLDSTPYLMDLETTNGTFINGEKLEPRRYYQLLQKDCVKFGASTREYVLLAEDAAGAGRR